MLLKSNFSGLNFLTISQTLIACQALQLTILKVDIPQGGGGGATQLYCCTHARPQVFRTHPKQVLSIGQIYTLGIQVFSRAFLTILPPKQV